MTTLRSLVARLVLLVACLAPPWGTHAQQVARGAWDLPERAREVVNLQSGAFDDAVDNAADRVDNPDQVIWNEAIDQGATAEEEHEESTIAKILDDRLKEEFKDDAGEDGKQYNETVLLDESKQETVVRISQGNGNKDEVREVGEGEAGTEHRNEASVESEVDRIIDSHDNEYVLSKPNIEGSMGLTLDPQLIRDMSLLIITSALAGQLMAALGQPTINGYFMAGSLLGQGGFGLAKEIVQLQSISQLGVQFLLFTLGLELNLAKLKAVRNVALFGGVLQVGLMAAMGSAMAFIIGAGAYQGAFVGSLLAMSSTSIVVKCIQEARVSHQPHAQITIGTLVLQDCVVGLIFAFMPVLASASSSSGRYTAGDIIRIIGKVFGTLSIAVIMTILFALMAAPAFVQFIKRSSAETFQVRLFLTFLSFFFLLRTPTFASTHHSPFTHSPTHPFTALDSWIRPAACPGDHETRHQCRAGCVHGGGGPVDHRGPAGHPARRRAHIKPVPGAVRLLHRPDHTACLPNRALYGAGVRRGPHHRRKVDPYRVCGAPFRVPAAHRRACRHQPGPSGGVWFCSAVDRQQVRDDSARGVSAVDRNHGSLVVDDAVLSTTEPEGCPAGRKVEPL
jgi:hypothetical protein